MNYWQIRITYSSDNDSELEFALELMQAEGHNYCSYTLTGAIEDDDLDKAILEPQPGCTPLWDDCRADILFFEDVDKAAVESRLRKLSFQINIEGWYLIKDKAWELEWLKYFRPLCIGEVGENQFWICPKDHSLAEDALPKLWLNPGLAFGSGSHNTTYLCLQWFATQEVENKTIVDFGCGSGILALSALVLKAKFAYCVDIDPQAITATQNNATNNNFNTSNLQTTLDYKQLPNACADLLFANILCKPLMELAPVLHQLTRQQGRICLSGLLKSQVDAVINCYRPYFTNFIVEADKDWVRITAVKC